MRRVGTFARISAFCYAVPMSGQQFTCKAVRAYRVRADAQINCPAVSWWSLDSRTSNRSKGWTLCQLGAGKLGKKGNANEVIHR